MGIGGLGIGDWAQSPIPNPQSPNKLYFLKIKSILILLNQNTINIFILKI